VRRGPFSSLTRRILAINVLALGVVVVGLLYLDDYRQGLIDAKADALTTQGRIIAAALGETVVVGDAEGLYVIDIVAARQLLSRLVSPTGRRARLFAGDGRLIADSRQLTVTGGEVQAEALPPPDDGPALRRIEAVYQWIFERLPPREALERYVEAENQSADDYREVRQALLGDSAWSLRDGGELGVQLIVAVPVQRFKLVQGALLLSTAIADVEESLREVRIAIVELFAIGLGITVLLSLYLAGTIARPIHRLAEAAEAVRHGHGGADDIPDFSARGDEIGDLSRSLADMTRELSDRLVEIERFAADVAHEIKNPLTSMTSALESLARIEDPERRHKLLAIMRDDVRRLDRLISDISDASRLDAELARAEIAPVDIGRMMAALVEVHRATAKPGDPVVELTPDGDDALVVDGDERRIAQLFENLIGNARSFSPPGGVIRLAARRRALDGADVVEVTVEDDGPGLPQGQLEAVFERFYSERPPGETFGIHSGLGLSISKQIVEAHNGVIFAENRGDDGGQIAGARFTVRLPV
jgi:two-component system sensor histidine kinase ChvG